MQLRNARTRSSGICSGAHRRQTYHEADELYDIGVGKTRDKKFLLLEIESKDTTEFRYLRASEPTKDFAVFLPREKKHRYYVDHRENEFFIRTNFTARTAKN